MARISEILLEQGRQQAGYRRRRGEIIGGLVQGLGQIPGAILADRQAAAAERAAAERQAMQDQRQARGDERADAQLGIQLSAEQRQVDAATAGQEEAAATKAAEERGKEQVRAWVKQHGHKLQPQEAEGILAAIEIPGGVQKALEVLTKAPEGMKLQSIDPTRPVMDMNTGTVVREGTPEAPKLTFGSPQTFMVGGRRTVVRAGSDGAMYDLQGNKVENVAPEPQQGAAPSFQSKEVLNDAGQPVTANYDARTGKYTDAAGQEIKNPRPVPGAMETQDARKFKQAEPILRSVSELSEKINTQQGLIAKISGAAERAKAQANYNDDVAEYEALISGFTPLVARALGHTGVLTQQDVDSVKALFPRPGDSKSLRDRKIGRIKSIIGELEAGAAPQGGASGENAADPLGLGF